MISARLRSGSGAGPALSALAADALDFLVGRSCLGCGGALPRGAAVCDACDARVPRTGTVFCLRCMQEGNAPSDATRPGGGCPRHGSERLLLAGPAFEPPLDRVVRAFKYSGAREAHRWLTALLPEPPGRGTPAWREYLLVPAPLHPARRAWRGFDQASLLAATAGAAWGIPVLPALERKRDTPAQARVDGALRRENVRQAFALAADAGRALRARPVLLVDDVATTGSTLLEAASALDAAAPSWVLSLAFAHGGLPGAPEPAFSTRVAAAPPV
ncbi:MAG TPA: ComF family protein [Candidatus Eisenbacteria bacterium]|nr:ComF family protein [Candidatus Eisenbacteria bacterium]